MAKMRFREIVVPMSVPFLSGPGSIATVLLFGNMTTYFLDFLFFTIVLLFVLGLLLLVFIFSVDLAKSLQQMGVEVFLAVSGVQLNSSQKKELEPLNYAHAAYKKYDIDNPWSNILEQGQWLMQLKNTFNSDLVHLNSFILGKFSWGVPVVSLIHSWLLSRSLALYNNMFHQWNKLKKMARESLRASDTVIALTQSMLRKAENFYGPFKNSHVIPYGRSEYNFRSRKKKNYIFCNGRLHDDTQKFRH